MGACSAASQNPGKLDLLCDTLPAAVVVYVCVWELFLTTALQWGNTMRCAYMEPGTGLLKCTSHLYSEGAVHFLIHQVPRDFVLFYRGFG